MEAASSQMTLLYAAARGYDAQVAQLINRKSINERDDMGNTPLRIHPPPKKKQQNKTKTKEPDSKMNNFQSIPPDLCVCLYTMFHRFGSLSWSRGHRKNSPES